MAARAGLLAGAFTQARFNSGVSVRVPANMPKGVNFPLYIPESCLAVTTLISAGRVDEVIEFLERKTAFGDTGAAALLGYLHLREAVPKPKTEWVREHLRSAANKGDPYAEFVLAIGLGCLGHPDASCRWMQKSAEHLFPPAQAHLGLYMFHGIGFAEPCRKSAFEMYKLALSGKHLPTLAFVTTWLRKSPLGTHRLLGKLLRPIAFTALTAQFLANPFGVRAFYHVTHEKLPMFTANRAATRRTT